MELAKVKALPESIAPRLALVVAMVWLPAHAPCSF
jgi:hypothetical protein